MSPAFCGGCQRSDDHGVLTQNHIKCQARETAGEMQHFLRLLVPFTLRDQMYRGP